MTRAKQVKTGDVLPTMGRDAVYSRDELSAMVVRMRAASGAFYREATAIGNHPFIEFCGLMNKYIDLCDGALRAGVDFTLANTHSGQPLPVAGHDMAYLAEKLDCIFGPTLRNSEEARRALLEGLGVAPRGTV